jgi:hypothetical protein
MVCRGSFRLIQCDWILMTNGRLSHYSWSGRVVGLIWRVTCCLPLSPINPLNSRGLMAKRGPYLGGSAVGVTTDVVRGAAGTSILRSR